MCRRAALVSLMVVITLAHPAFGQNPPRWKFQEGDTFYLEEKINSKTSVTANGEKSTDEQTQYRLSRFEVKSSSPTEGIVLEQMIEKWQSKITAKPGVDRDDTKILEKVCDKLVLTLYLSPQGKITRFNGYDKFLENLAAADPEEHKKFKVAAGTDDVLRGPLAQIFDILPAEALKKGQTWRRDSIVKLGPLGEFKLATTFTYDSLSKRGERINTRAILSFVPPKATAGDLGFKILKLNLTKKEAAGHLIFDNAKGHLVEMERSTPLAGTLVLEIQGKQSEIQLDGTETRVTRLLDTRPQAPKTEELGKRGNFLLPFRLQIGLR